MSLMSLALAGGFFTTSSTWEAPQGAHIKPNHPKALTHQRASRGTRQALPQTFSKGAGPFSYCVLFFTGCTGCKILLWSVSLIRTRLWPPLHALRKIAGDGSRKGEKQKLLEHIFCLVKAWVP